MATPVLDGIGGRDAEAGFLGADDGGKLALHLAADSDEADDKARLVAEAAEDLRAAHADLRVLFGGAHALMREAGALLAEAEQLDRARSAAEDERSSMNK